MHLLVLELLLSIKLLLLATQGRARAVRVLSTVLIDRFVCGASRLLWQPRTKLLLLALWRFLVGSLVLDVLHVNGSTSRRSPISNSVVSQRWLMTILLFFWPTITGTELPLLSCMNRWNPALMLRSRAQARLFKSLDQSVLISLKIVNGLLHVLEFLTHLIALLDPALKLATDLCNNFHATLKLLICIVCRGCWTWRACSWFFEMSGKSLICWNKPTHTRQF